MMVINQVLKDLPPPHLMSIDLLIDPALHTLREVFATKDARATDRKILCSLSCTEMLLLLGISAGFPGIRGHGVERCIGVHQAPQALEGVVRLRVWTGSPEHLNTKFHILGTSLVICCATCCLTGSMPPGQRWSLVDVDRCQMLPSTSNFSLGSKCLSTDALELWATCLYATWPPTPQRNTCRPCVSHVSSS